MTKILLLSVCFAINFSINPNSLGRPFEKINFPYKTILADKLKMSGFELFNNETRLSEKIYYDGFNSFGIYMAIEYAIIDFAKKHSNEPELVQVIRNNKDLILATILESYPESVECLKEYKKMPTQKTDN